MVLTHIAIALWAVLVPGPAQASPPQAEASMSFELSVPPDTALPLFGPVRETEWSPTWQPRFIAPADGSNSQEGTVFTIGSESGRSVWILNEYSVPRQSIRYTVVGPDRTTEIHVQLTPRPGGHSEVRVTERVTALSREGEQIVSGFREHFATQGEHWRSAIETRLQSKPR